LRYGHFIGPFAKEADAEMRTGPETDRLSRVKAIVAETLKFPGTTEETKLAILTEMETSPRGRGRGLKILSGSSFAEVKAIVGSGIMS